MANSSAMDSRSSQVEPSPAKSTRTEQGLILAATPTADREMNDHGSGMFVEAASTHDRDSVVADEDEEAPGPSEERRMGSPTAALTDADPGGDQGASSSGSAVQTASAIMAMLDREAASQAAGDAASTVACVTRVAGDSGGRVIVERHEVKFPEKRGPEGPFTGDEVRGLLHATVYEAEARHRAKLEEAMRFAAQRAHAEAAEAHAKIAAGAKEEAQEHVRSVVNHLNGAAEQLYQQVLVVTQERDEARHQAEQLVGNLTSERDEARRAAEGAREHFVRAAAEAEAREKGWTEAAAAARSKVEGLEALVADLTRTKDDLLAERFILFYELRECIPDFLALGIRHRAGSLPSASGLKLDFPPFRHALKLGILAGKERGLRP